MDGNPDDPIEVGARVNLNVEAVENTIPDAMRMAIHETVDKILNRVDAVNLDYGLSIQVESIEAYTYYDIDRNLHREFPKQYSVVARGMTKLKHLKENDE